MCSVGCSVSLMRRGVIATAALMAVLSLTPAAIPQQSQSPVATPAPGETSEAGPTIIAPQSSRAGRALFDQKRYSEAKPLLEKACNLGNADSCGLLGDFYFYGYGGVEQDYKQTRLLDKQACEWGSIESCGNLGQLYEKGLGGSRDYATARALYKKACNGGSAGSKAESAAGSMARCSALGMLYLNGQGGAQDYEQARAFFRKACDGGFMLGCAALGSLYQNGQGYTSGSCAGAHSLRAGLQRRRNGRLQLAGQALRNRSGRPPGLRAGPRPVQAVLRRRIQTGV